MKTSSRHLPLFIAVLAIGGAASLSANPANKKAAANYFEHFLPATLADCTLCHLPSTNHAPESLEEFPHNAFGKELAAIKKKSLPERLKLVADKDSYEPGDKAKILIRSPFDQASGLLVVEREGIADTHVLKVEGGAAVVEKTATCTCSAASTDSSGSSARPGFPAPTSTTSGVRPTAPAGNS